MKVICLLCDSLNRHFLNLYGGTETETPNLDWFARRAHTFDRHHSGSVPTMPTRRELWTGNHEFLWRPWGALEPWDDEIVKVLRDQDILTMLITDSYHLFERGSSNYHFNFEGWEFFRGFENDPWVTEPSPGVPHAGRNLPKRHEQNLRRLVYEEDLPLVKTLSCVDDWLKTNHTHDQFFLMVDEFAPHEPFLVPEYYRKKYDADYDGVPLYWPAYGKDLYSPRDVEHLRRMYGAHVELLDKYIGRVFETMTLLDMWKDTAFVLMTDHGHYLGEHGWTGKPQCPTYETLTHIPFMVYLPGMESDGARVNALTANVDVFPTVLDLFGVAPPTPVHGRSVLPLLKGDADGTRDSTLYGYYGRSVNITDGRFSYLRVPRENDAPLYIYSNRWEFERFRDEKPLNSALEMGEFMCGVDMPVGRMPLARESAEASQTETQDMLFDTETDPGQENNLVGTADEKRMEELLRAAMLDINAPPEQLARFGL